MNNIDFFAEYEGQKRRSERIFEALDKKINSNKGELDEAFFGLIGGKKNKKDDSSWEKLSPEEQEEIFESHFEIALQNIEDKELKIDLGGGRIVKVVDLSPFEKYEALEIFKKQASKFNFKPTFIESGGFLVYGQSQNKQQDSSKEQDSNKEQESSPTYQITYDKKSGKYFFGSTDRYVMEINNATSELQTYNWQKSPLKYLFENPLKFGLRELVFDLKEGKIATARDGFWIGDFSGGLFEASFVGNNFKGRFFNNNEEWKSKQTAFISGTFSDKSKSGILGLNDVKQGNENYAFHLIQLPENYSVEILTDKQLRHTIICEKRLNNINSNFIYSVYMGYDIDQSSPNRVTLTWEDIRANYDSFKVGKKMKSLPGLFSLVSDENIIEMRVVEVGTPPSFKKKEKFDDTKEYIENTSNLRGLKQISGSQYNRNLKFDITNDSEFENLNKIKGYINSKQFEDDLKKASVYLDNKLISAGDIKSKFPYLVNVFTPEVISEAIVNLANPKKSYGRTGFASSSNLKNPITGRKFEEPYEIADYLNQKYKDEIEANGGRKPVNYQKEYSDLYNAVFGQKTASATVKKEPTNSPTDIGGMSKDEDVVLKRIENFVKYFVYKIDDGKNTNKIRKYFIDLLKSKITAHKEPVQVTATSTTTPSATPTTSTTTTSATPTTQASPTAKKTKASTTPKKGGVGKIQKESFVRGEIRKLLKELL
jgi:cell division septation protein DedD